MGLGESRQSEQSAEPAINGKQPPDAEAAPGKNWSDYEIAFHQPFWEKLYPERRDKVAAHITIGHLVYWAGVAIAAAALVLGTLTLMTPAQDNKIALFLFGAAVGIWFLGRVIRYLFAGR